MFYFFFVAIFYMLDPQDRFFIHANQRSPIHKGMNIENTFDLLGEQHIVIRDHTMRLTSTIP